MNQSILDLIINSLIVANISVIAFLKVPDEYKNITKSYGLLFTTFFLVLTLSSLFFLTDSTKDLSIHSLLIALLLEKSFPLEIQFLLDCCLIGILVIPLLSGIKQKIIKQHNLEDSLKKVKKEKEQNTESSKRRFEPLKRDMRKAKNHLELFLDGYDYLMNNPEIPNHVKDEYRTMCPKLKKVKKLIFKNHDAF